jgi:hypothetical protein
LHGAALLDEEHTINGKRVEFHVLGPSGSAAADVVIIGTTPLNIRLKGAELFRKYETRTREEHNLQGALWYL